MAAHTMSLDSRLRGNDRTVGSLALFDDGVDNWSAGGFPKEITTDSLTRRHVSAQRNPIIADVFYRTGLIEKWGRGTNRVIAECERHGISPPVFEERQGFVVVTFNAPMVPVAETATAQAIGRKTSEKILALMARHPEITIAEIARGIGVSTRSIERNLKNVHHQGRLKRVGPDRGGHWEVVK